MPTQRERYLTVEELADRLRISRDGAYRLCRRDDFPAVRVERLIRVPADELGRWLENQSVD